MVKLIALYRQPEDAAAFDQHYEEVHSPLAMKMPGLEKVEITKILGTPQGASEYYLMAELYFKDVETLTASMRSPEGKAAAKDVMGFAGTLVSMHIGEVK